MFDPTIGRWLEMDPIAFDAGDANLYRYGGNNPTNAIDPSGEIPVPGPAFPHGGLQNEDRYALSDVSRGLWRDDDNTDLLEGTNITGTNLRHPIIRNWNGDAGASAFVSVYTGCQVWDADGHGTDLNNAIELECIVRGSSESNPVKDTHWIQFVRRAMVIKSLDTDEVRAVQGQEYRTGDVLHVYGSPVFFLDTPSTKSPWYDDPYSGGAYRRTPDEISIFDEPGFDLDPLFVRLLPGNFRMILEFAMFDAYLVNQSKVVYHVHWEIQVSAPLDDSKPHYGYISGEPANKLPAGATVKGQFIRGYKKDAARTPDVIPNRIK